MVERYKKTFWGMQAVIWLVSFGVLAWAHMWSLAALFFVTMQVGAVVGAMWATRLKNRLEPHT